MASATATVTAKTGPASQITTLVFQNVTSINFNYVAQSAEIIYNNGLREFIDLSGVTTITTGISGSNYTITIS